MTFKGVSLEDALALPYRTDPRGYRYVWLGHGHPLARKSGQQWLHRLVAMICLRRILPAGEHVHHLNGDKGDCRPANLEVLYAEYHGALHCAFTPLTEIRRGRLVAKEEPGPTFRGNRRGAVLQVALRRRAVA